MRSFLPLALLVGLALGDDKPKHSTHYGHLNVIYGDEVAGCLDSDFLWREKGPACDTFKASLEYYEGMGPSYASLDVHNSKKLLCPSIPAVGPHILGCLKGDPDANYNWLVHGHGATHMADGTVISTPNGFGRVYYSLGEPSPCSGSQLNLNTYDHVKNWNVTLQWENVKSSSSLAATAPKVTQKPDLRLATTGTCGNVSTITGTTTETMAVPPQPTEGAFTGPGFLHIIRDGKVAGCVKGSGEWGLMANQSDCYKLDFQVDGKTPYERLSIWSYHFQTSWGYLPCAFEGSDYFNCKSGEPQPFVMHGSYVVAGQIPQYVPYGSNGTWEQTFWSKEMPTEEKTAKIIQDKADIAFQMQWVPVNGTSTKNQPRAVPINFSG